MNNWQTKAQAILADPATSYPLQRAIRDFLGRDPVDALNDAEIFLAVFKARYKEVIADERTRK